MTVAPAPPRPSSSAAGRCGNAGRPDLPGLLDRLRSPGARRPAVDAGLAGGLRAWLEDGVTGAVGTEARGGTLAVHDGVPVPCAPERGAARPPGPGGVPGVAALRTCLTRAVFRLTVTSGPPRHPFEDALCAISVTERGPETLGAVRRLPREARAALRSSVRARAATIAGQWGPIPRAWLPRTGERLSVALAGGAVVLGSSADLVLGRPSDGTASVCLLRVQDGQATHGVVGQDRARRALALAETLRSGAPPWRVADYDPGTGRLRCEDADEELLVAAVHDVLGALALGAVRRERAA